MESEINAYLADETTYVSLLGWWQVCIILFYFIVIIELFTKENQHHYPTIFKMALDYLPIQASSVPCKRVFSSSKETCSARCSRITPELMEALQVLKFHVKQGNSLDFTKRTSVEIEIEELIVDSERARAIPEDIEKYMKSLLLN